MIVVKYIRYHNLGPDWATTRSETPFSNSNYATPQTLEMETETKKYPANL